MTVATMTDHEKELDLFQKVRGYLAEWMTRHKELAELKQLDHASLQQLAEDVGITADELLLVTLAGQHGADEMPSMMRALNIDPAAVDARDHAAFRSMEAACATCSNKSGCRADLKAGTAPEHYVSYCRNTELLNALRAEPEMLLS